MSLSSLISLDIFILFLSLIPLFSSFSYFFFLPQFVNISFSITFFHTKFSIDFNSFDFLLIFFFLFSLFVISVVFLCSKFDSNNFSNCKKIQNSFLKNKNQKLKGSILQICLILLIYFIYSIQKMEAINYYDESF